MGPRGFEPPITRPKPGVLAQTRRRPHADFLGKMAFKLNLIDARLKKRL